jgi:hypothetical protein
MWQKLLNMFGIKTQKTPVNFKIMIVNSTDLFVLMEVTQDGVTTSEPMQQDALSAYIAQKYGDQPLRYFNEYKRLKVIHLKSGKIKDAAVQIDFQ